MKFFKDYIFKFKLQTFYKKSGFTLVEALVAISILMIAIASPMTLAQKGLSTATLSKDQMTATFLAQDAIEAVKNIRDQIALDPNNESDIDWLQGRSSDKNGIGLGPCICDTKNGDICNFDKENFKFCTIDTTKSDWATGDNGSIKSYINLTGSLEDGHELGINMETNKNTNVSSFVKYDYDSNSEKSKFTRYINIEKTSELEGNEAKVNVRVSWKSTTGEQKIDLQNFIYNYSANI